VWIVQPDRTVSLRYVQVGVMGPDESEIVSGMSSGDIVITDGVDRLQQGTRVSVHMSSGRSGGGMP